MSAKVASLDATLDVVSSYWKSYSFLLWARLPTPVPYFVFGGVKVAFLDATLRCGFDLGNHHYLVVGKVGRASAH